jgi:hypothetical protein
VIPLLAMLATLTAAQEPASPDTSLAAAPPDTVPVALQMPEVRDFFDTGVSATTAVLMSPVFPGWGQLYAEGSWQAMVAFGAQWFFWSNMLTRDRQAVRSRDYAKTLSPGSDERAIWDFRADEYYEQMRDFAWWSGAVLLLVALDSYVEAGLYGFDDEPVPVPDRFDEFFDTSLPEPPGSRGAPNLVIWQWSKTF